MHLNLCAQKKLQILLLIKDRPLIGHRSIIGLEAVHFPLDDLK